MVEMNAAQREGAGFQHLHIADLFESFEQEWSPDKLSPAQQQWVDFAQHVAKNGMSIVEWKFVKGMEETRDGDCEMLSKVFIYFFGIGQRESETGFILAGWMLSKMIKSVPEY